MKLSVSNIAWGAEDDERMYKRLSEMGYEGLEVAPTRLFSEAPYVNPERAGEFAAKLKREHGLVVCSMQSIWYGREERIFEGLEHRLALLEHSRLAAGFARDIGCCNLVFGNPRNRIIGGPSDMGVAIEFFSSLGEIGESFGVVFAIEPNPTIYGTNFLNTTQQAAEFIREIGSDNIRLNVDFGTIIENCEGIDAVGANIDIVNHVHISEPNLVPIRRSDAHTRLAGLLRSEHYEGFVSIEMRRQEQPDQLLDAMEYVKATFA
jgi:sugar phosphate isomerase/epimerase